MYFLMMFIFYKFECLCALKLMLNIGRWYEKSAYVFDLNDKIIIY